MTRAGFLSSYSHYDATGPILRGAFITIYMIGVDPGPPTPGATMMQPPAGNYKTQRETTDALVNQSASCKGCHTAIINPPGFVLENYDAIGKWQTVDHARRRSPSTPTATVNFGDGNDQADHIAQAADAGDRRTSRRRSRLYAQSLGRLCVRAGSERERPMRRRSAQHQAGARRLHAFSIVLADLTQADSFRLRVRELPEAEEFRT